MRYVLVINSNYFRRSNIHYQGTPVTLRSNCLLCYILISTVIHLQFWAYGSWDSLFPISMSPSCKLMRPEHIFLTTSLQYYCILGLAEIKTLHPRDKSIPKDAGFSGNKVSKGAKIRSRYNQVPHPTQDTNGKVTNSQLDTTNESQEVSPFPAGDHKAHINRRAHRHCNL